ncbi:olfactory receptor 52D1-like [Carettochelys insculpta]|uniref:olfactory receptor 52D1-like n=1 Tax=Carettochelys insculpta TaxID=44489 RepID=UPI003EB9DD36
MAAFHLTFTNTSTFILMGIPGLEYFHLWISIPFSFSYFTCLLGNVTLLFVVGKDQTLHKPMYLLIFMLALTDICITNFFMPKALCIFWFDLKDITADGCLTQMFFLHMLSFTQSAIFVLMSFDRYVAICNPLRYTTFLTNARIVKLGFVGLLRSAVLILPLPLLLSRQPFCANRMIAQTHCEHMAVAKLSCGEIRVSSVYSLVVTIVVVALDRTLIFLSYGFIIKAVFRISSNKPSWKALNTCTVHICVMLTSFIPGFFTSLTHRFGQGIAPHIHVILANVYLLLPPMLNPIIYGFHMKELYDKVGKYTCRR